MEDLDHFSVRDKDDEEIVLERLLCRATWQIAWLGSIDEPAMRPTEVEQLENEVSRIRDEDFEKPAYLDWLFQMVESEEVVEEPDSEGFRWSGDAHLDSEYCFWIAQHRMRQATWNHDHIESDDEAGVAALRMARDEWDGKALQSIREGLERNPHHLASFS